MEEDAKYIPRSAKATDFKITLSACAKEDEERVSFLEQQIQQAKDSYESSLKSVIEECIALEIQAAKKEESQLIMDLFPAIGKAIQQLQGTDCDAHLQTVNALKMTPALLEYGPIENIINFLHFYRNHHTLDEVPKARVRTTESEYATVTERTKALRYHTASLQRPENSGIQLYICLEGILVIPTAAYDKQVDENKRLLNVKKLSNEIIMGKTTEDTVMELDGEGAANFEQLQDLIRKECDKRDRKYAQLEDKCNKLEQQVKNHQKTMPKRGHSPNHEEPGTSKKNKSNQRNAPKQQRSRSKSIPPNNSGAKNRQNHESPKQAGEKNSDSKQKSTNKPPSLSHSKSNRNPPNHSGKKIPPKRQQRRNSSHNLDSLVTQQYLTTQCLYHSNQNANLVLLLTAIQHGVPRLHETTQTTKKLMITPWTRLKIYPDTESNKLLEPTKTVII